MRMLDLVRALWARAGGTIGWTIYWIVLATYSLVVSGLGATLVLGSVYAGVWYGFKHRRKIAYWLGFAYVYVRSALVDYASKAYAYVPSQARKVYGRFTGYWTSVWVESRKAADLVAKARANCSSALRALFLAEESAAKSELKARRLAREHGATVTALDNAYLDGGAYSVLRQQKREAQERVVAQETVVRTAWNAIDEADASVDAANAELAEAKKALRRG